MAFIGINGKAREVSDLFVGVDNKARQAILAYLGDQDGVARLWWGTSGGDNPDTPGPVIPEPDPVPSGAPVFAERDTWWKRSNRATVTSITIHDYYVPEGAIDFYWTADEGATGSIMCYRIGNEVHISGNGSGKLRANPDAMYMFSTNTLSSTYGFTKLTAINGLELLDTSSTYNFGYMFTFCNNLQELDLRSFYTGLEGYIIQMSNMFKWCYGLSEIKVGPGWTTENAETTGMFDYCGVNSVTRYA